MPENRFCSIDIGSNTIKMIVVDRDEQGNFQSVLTASRPARLGEGIHARRLREIAMRRGIDALGEFAAICQENGVARIAAVGTSALRDADNKQEFIDRAREVGIEVEAIPGEEEARLSFLAVRRDPQWRDAEHLIVIDIGGGSTEIILGEGDKIHDRVSLPLGAVRLSEAALHSDPPTIQQIAEANKLALKGLQGLRPAASNSVAVGVGGTLSNMARVGMGIAGTVPEPGGLHGARLTLESVEAQVDLYAARTVEERKAIAGLDPARADVILGGAIILCQALQRAELDSLSISIRGLRWGLVYDRFGR